MVLVTPVLETKSGRRSKARQITRKRFPVDLFVGIYREVFIAWLQHAGITIKYFYNYARASRLDILVAGVIKSQLMNTISNTLNHPQLSEL